MSEVTTFLNEQATALREVVSSLENFEAPEFDIENLSYDEKWEVVRDVVAYYPEDVIEELQTSGQQVGPDLSDLAWTLRQIKDQVQGLGGTDLEDVMGEVEEIASGLDNAIYEIESNQ